MGVLSHLAVRTVQPRRRAPAMDKCSSSPASEKVEDYGDGTSVCLAESCPIWVLLVDVKTIAKPSWALPILILTVREVQYFVGWEEGDGWLFFHTFHTYSVKHADVLVRPGVCGLELPRCPTGGVSLGNNRPLQESREKPGAIPVQPAFVLYWKRVREKEKKRKDMLWVLELEHTRWCSPGCTRFQEGGVKFFRVPGPEELQNH